MDTSQMTPNQQHEIRMAELEIQRLTAASAVALGVTEMLNDMAELVKGVVADHYTHRLNVIEKLVAKEGTKVDLKVTVAV